MRMALALVVGSLVLPCPSVAEAETFTDAIFCRWMQDFATQANKDAGTKVDAVTTHEGLAVLCNMKLVDFKKRLEVPFTAMKAGWDGRKQAQWNQIYCTDPGFMQAIKSGWRISSTMTDVEGNRHYMEATCP